MPLNDSRNDGGAQGLAGSQGIEAIVKSLKPVVRFACRLWLNGQRESLRRKLLKPESSRTRFRSQHTLFVKWQKHKKGGRQAPNPRNWDAESSARLEDFCFSSALAGIS